MNIVSFGGGTNSAAMIVGMWRSSIPIDLILFADTGGEQPHTSEFIKAFNVWLAERSLPAITPVYYHTKDGQRLALEDECLRYQTLPSAAYGQKRCSIKHKIGPQDKYCNNNKLCRQTWAKGDRVHKFIGYDAGETKRVTHTAQRDAIDRKFIKHYPLLEWGWDRNKCLSVILSEGLPSPGKSSCFFCPNMRKNEIISLYENNPTLFERALRIEQRAMPTLQKIKGLGRNWSWADLINTYIQDKSDGEFAESPNGCGCGMPCGCYDG